MEDTGRRILITTSSFAVEGNAALQRLAGAGFEVVVNPHGRRLTEDEALTLIESLQPVGMIAGVEPLTARVLGVARQLRHVARCGTGMDSVDMAAAGRLRIEVSNTPGGPTVAVVELTIGVLLALLRRICEADRKLRAGDWQQLQGHLLSQRCVGVVGFGRIGRRVAELLTAFGARVVVHDPLATDTAGFERFEDLDELFAVADVVTLHVPLTEETRNLVDARRLALMGPHAVLLNLSRGGLVDEAALVAALEEDRLAGACIDCFEHEPYTGDLTRFDRVVLTAHMGSYAAEARRLMEAEAADNLERGLLAAFDEGGSV